MNRSPGGRAPDSRYGSALRFGTELIAWIATPWALTTISWVLAAVSVIVLIGLPTVFTTPGDKANVIVPVPGIVTIALNLLQFTAAGVSAWFAWPDPFGALVSVLVVAAIISQIPRWRWLVTASSRV